MEPYSFRVFHYPKESGKSREPNESKESNESSESKKSKESKKPGEPKRSFESWESKRSKEPWESKRPKESPWESFEGSGVCPRREDASGEENATQSSLRLCQCHFFSSPPSISKNSNFGNKNRVGKHWGWAGWECHSSLYLPTSQVRQVVSEVF